MKRWGAAVLALATACVHVDEDTRVERGPLLRTYEREGPSSPGGLKLRVQAHWPEVTFSFSRYELCRHEQVEEYAEEHITEKTSPSAGAALASGVTTSLLGGVLWLARGAFSSAPDTKQIDGGGHYGPSDRTNATVWSVVLMGLGVPAMAVGGIGLWQTGEVTRTERVAQVASSKDSLCNETPAKGHAELLTERGPSGRAFETQGVGLALQESMLRGLDVTGVALDGQPAVPGEADAATLQAFKACLQLTAAPAEELADLSKLSVGRLKAVLRQARECSAVPDGPGRELLPRLEEEWVKRPPAPEAEGPRLETFQDALAAYPPQHKFFPGDDGSSLSRADEWVGQAIQLQGMVLEPVQSSIAVLEVCGTRVLVLVPQEATWAAAVKVGEHIEVVGVIQGKQVLGDLQAALIRAVWIRPAL